ncbi:probable basic-leucine zipper transcription factor N [Bactrocera dorsalis]|uniref:Probable basic-leucine zipper transcription factor N n=1 Tax=Bactrocera dorsalis TaxID=27457 RepID=A0A6I9VEZ3_BACDO|nr:probable basic-leucine zipper transcription factor N [Bactrocera dorsalis]
MKIFVTISLTLAALATADISLRNGYNYQVQQPLISQIVNSLAQQQQQQQQQQPQHLPGSIHNPMQITQPSQQYIPALQQSRRPLLPQQQLPSLPPQQQLQALAHIQSQPPQQQVQSPPLQQPLGRLTQNPVALPMPSNFPSSAGFQVPIAPVSASKQSRRLRSRVKVPKKAIVTKSFFIHSAPEENEEEVQDELNQLAAQPRKHYNVLFVKTPAQTSKAAAVNLAKALNEEKTVVYVLSKKTSAADLQDAIQEAPQHINKPEVFFIKYRTPEEAANAQRQIQSQYDSLGGTSTITDEGLAPVTSVVGSLDASEEEDVEDEQQLVQQQPAAQDGSYEDQFPNAINPPASGQYLPPLNQY